jgi:hypothetical protein
MPGQCLLHVRPAGPRPGLHPPVTAETLIARVGAVGVARLQAGAAIANAPRRTRRKTFVALRGTFHPHRHLCLGREDRKASLALCAGHALAIGAIDHRAYRSVPVIVHALLARGASASLAGGAAGGAWAEVRAIEPLGTTGRVVQLARAATPPVRAPQPGLTCGFLGLRYLNATFPFLAYTLGDAEAHERTVLHGPQRHAGGALGTLGIRLARAVGAIGSPGAGVGKTAQGRFTVRTAHTVAPVGHQLPPLFLGEHRAQRRSCRCGCRRPLSDCDRDKQSEWRRKQQPSEEAAYQPPVHPHRLRHSGLVGSGRQTSSYACWVHCLIIRPSLVSLAAARSRKPSLPLKREQPPAVTDTTLHTASMSRRIQISR